MARSFASVASASFESVLRELGLDRERAGDPSELGQRAALVVAAEMAWTGHLGPLLEAKQVERLLGVRTRQAVSDLRTRGRLLGLLRKAGRIVYPAFQFADRGRPFASMKEILAIFEGVDVDEWTIASWFVTPKALLGGVTPAAWLRDGRDASLVLTAAQRTAARLAH